MNTCKVCGEQYTGGVFLELVCSYGCAELFYSKVDEEKRKAAAFDWMVRYAAFVIDLGEHGAIVYRGTKPDMGEIGRGINGLDAIERVMKKEE